MRRLADGDRVEPRGHDVGNRRPFREHQRQRAGPESLHEPPCPSVDAGRIVGDRGGVRNVDDQRVEARAVLDGIDVRHGPGVERVGAEPVHGFRRKGHEAAVPQSDRGARYRTRVVPVENVRHVLIVREG